MISPPLKVYVSGFPFLSCHNGWYTLKNEKTYVKDEALFETKIINSYTTYIKKTKFDNWQFVETTESGDRILAFSADSNLLFSYWSEDISVKLNAPSYLSFLYFILLTLWIFDTFT